jgi:hypothetical protein
MPHVHSGDIAPMTRTRIIGWVFVLAVAMFFLAVTGMQLGYFRP